MSAPRAAAPNDEKFAAVRAAVLAAGDRDRALIRAACAGMSSSTTTWATTVVALIGALDSDDHRKFARAWVVKWIRQDGTVRTASVPPAHGAAPE